MDGKLFKDKAFVFLNKLDTGDVRLLHEGTTRDGQLHVGIYRTFLGDEESNTTYHVLTTPNNDNPDSRIAYSTARENDVVYADIEPQTIRTVYGEAVVNPDGTATLGGLAIGPLQE